MFVFLPTGRCRKTFISRKDVKMQVQALRGTLFFRRTRMIKVGTRVLSKKTNVESKLLSVRGDEDGRVIYTFERKEGGDTMLTSVPEELLEEVFYFLVEDHPVVQDVDRRKSKKTREKVTQPSDVEEFTSLSLLN